ncbi:hypothetical protein [Streptomyces sp. H27-D2]|uniref:hypothetical protein n=1 Tax=Streptomyces sp. H27-D2 TaxID=3046304 RepID=UPI002DB7CE79|nr:hypothetical protein [Streptomyces sp. H27-D2]MEC4018458.1 hypothetical protein [Streptomyces sp. H27-D2]
MADHSAPAATRQTDDAGELAALIDAGGFWRLAPEWVPRAGYATPTPDLLRDVEAGLRRWIV